MSKMTIVHGDDWSGVYVNGTLCTEGHFIEPLNLVEITLAGGVTIVEEKLCDVDWLNDLGSFPKRLKEVKFEQTSAL